MQTTRTNAAILIVTLALLLALVPHSADAAAGIPDRSFGVGGKVTSDFGQSNDLAYGMALQPDGKLVVAGIRFTGNSSETGDFSVARYNPNGSLDTTFGQNGQVTTDFGMTETAVAVVIQPDGKIIVGGGSYPIFTTLGQFALARYNSDGSLDTSFGSGGLVRTSFGSNGCFAFALVLQPDGKIIAAGSDYIDANPETLNSDFAVARYNSDGTLDPTFGIGGEVHTEFHGFVDDAFAVLLQRDGRIIAVGDATSPATDRDFALVRYLANGDLDSTFGVGGKVETDLAGGHLDQARSAVLQRDGRIVAAGTTVTDGSGLVQLFAIVRYNHNGTLDPHFGGNGLTTVDFGSFLQSAHSLLLQRDGKLIATGFPDTESSDSDFLLTRLNSDGSLDTTFGAQGRLRTSFGNLNGGANASVLQPDGRIIAGGFIATGTNKGVDFALARYLGN